MGRCLWFFICSTILSFLMQTCMLPEKESKDRQREEKRRKTQHRKSDGKIDNDEEDNRSNVNFTVHCVRVRAGSRVCVCAKIERRQKERDDKRRDKKRDRHRERQRQGKDERPDTK